MIVFESAMFVSRNIILPVGANGALGGDYFIRPAAGRVEFSPMNAVSTRGTF
jgi:hypothetical protein